MPQIFISYRRADSAVVASRIYDKLVDVFGTVNVFKDVESIPLGKDFRAEIEREIMTREVMLVIIGPSWATITDEQGRRRLDDRDDFVRIEIELALRHGLEVIPVLMAGAQMPNPDDLPPDMRPLTFHNAATLRADPLFDQSVAWLIDQISGRNPRRLSRPSVLAGVGLIALLILVGGGAILASTIGGESGENLPKRTTNTAQADTTIQTAPVTDYSVTTANETSLPSPTQGTASPQAANTIEPAHNEASIDTINQNCVSTIPMTYLPATTFKMGSDTGDEKPIRQITVDAFCINMFEVTNQLYAECVQLGECTPPQDSRSRLYADYYENPAYARFPVINVTWSQAQEYCAFRNGRLPTEAEWELAARDIAGEETTRIYPWGNSSPDASRANFSGVGIGDAVEVGQHPDGQTASGIQDLSGNVAEWVYDRYGVYDPQALDNPQGPTFGDFRVLRGGSYASDSAQIRVSTRDKRNPENPSNRVGFRCVVSSK